jgi:hypothetical protein
MKLITLVTACLLLAGVAQAQNTKVRKSAIGGTIKDARRQPINKVQAYIYRNDTIAASGYTIADGSYETNNVKPGTYELRLVYPSTRRISITGVPVKMLKITTVSLMTSEPLEDSTIAYTDLYPNTVVKKKW